MVERQPLYSQGSCFFFFSLDNVPSSILTFRFHSVYFHSVYLLLIFLFYSVYNSENCFFFIVAMNSFKQDILFVYNISPLHLACKDFKGIIPSSIPAFSHFILVSIAEIVFHFYGSHEQFHMGCCVWNFSLHHPAHKDFIGIIPSSIPAFFAFYTGVHCRKYFYLHGSHEQFHIGYCVWIVSLLHLARKDFIGLIPFFILAFLHFILVSIK